MNHRPACCKDSCKACVMMTRSTPSAHSSSETNCKCADRLRMRSGTDCRCQHRSSVVGLLPSTFTTMTCLFVLLLGAFITPASCNLWTELQSIGDLSQWRHMCGQYPVARAYMEDSKGQNTVFAPVDDVFTHNADLMAMGQKQVLAHIVDQQVPEIATNKKWQHQTLIRHSVGATKVFLTQFEHNPGNFSYFANNGRVCNHVSSTYARKVGDLYMYKICTPMGKRGFAGTAFEFIRTNDQTQFNGRGYTNNNLKTLRNVLDRTPDVGLVIYGGGSWRGYHTYFLPTDAAFARVPDRRKLDRDVLLAHVSGANRVYFTHSWLYDGGIHSYPTVKFTSSVVEDNIKLKLSMRNITDRRTGRWEVYAVSEVLQQYGQFRRGSVWARVVVPNIPVQNGVVHIVDNVLGIVSKTIDQLLNENPKCRTLMQYVNTIGQLVRGFFSAQGGLVTFFAPVNEAFERIPDYVEKRMLRDRVWLEQILKLHIAPSMELTSDQITNDTQVNAIDKWRRLFFVRGEWPKNNISECSPSLSSSLSSAYYVIGGGVKATILLDNVAATNGIIHYIDRVLGVPYQPMLQIIKNETNLQTTYSHLKNLQLSYSLNPWQVVRSQQNFTFFVPTDEAWANVPAGLRQQFTDGDHWQALQFVYKRHIIQGQALMVTDLRERSYVMMNDEKVIIRRRGRYFELEWPYGRKVAQIVPDGEVAAINGFMHKINSVLVIREDLTAGVATTAADSMLTLLAVYISMVGLFRR